MIEVRTQNKKKGTFDNITFRLSYRILQMLFNSYVFILIFFPIVCISYYLINIYAKNKVKLLNAFILVASLVFYAYAGIKSCIIILLVTGWNYLLFRLIIYSINWKMLWKRYLLILGVCTNLLVLMYFKYYNFFIGTINIFGKKQFSTKDIIAPLGISFLVFQQIAFLVDASRNEIKKCSLIEYCTYVLFFPHVSSGPILLHNDLMPILRSVRKVDWDNIASGIYLFVMGLGKKVLIADMLAEAVDWGYANLEGINSTSAIWITILYTLQIYFDFSGYSDMAIGISRVLQMDLPVNFNSPYKSKTILEFWDRWHITLTRFFTKYLYIPLGGNRKGALRTYANTMIVFILSGLWHGASYTFILWGFLHGCFMVITKKFIKFFNKLPNWVNQTMTLLFVNFTWILFRAGSLGTFKAMLLAIAKCDWGNLENSLCQPFVPGFFTYQNNTVFMQIWAVAVVLVLFFVVLRCKNVEEWAGNRKHTFLSCIAVIIIAVVCVLSFGGVNSFIYLNF